MKIVKDIENASVGDKIAIAIRLQNVLSQLQRNLSHLNIDKSVKQGIREISKKDFSKGVAEDDWVKVLNMYESMYDVFSVRALWIEKTSPGFFEVYVS